MSGVFGILFYIIIFCVIINAKKEAKSGEGKRKNNTVPERGAGQGKVFNYGEKTGVPNVQKKKLTPNVPKERQQATPNVPRKKKMERRFMEPHREETLQPKIRNNNLWGEDKYANRRIVALRLMEGDPVPNGYEVIRCPYCAAENLVTGKCKQYHSCYFCRVPID